MYAPLLNMLVALGAGLLIGLERERSSAGSGEAVAGLRTFALAALAGAVSAEIGGAALLGVTAGVAALFAGLSYWRTLTQQGPGLTTELALVFTVLIGGLAMTAPNVAGAVAVITALLLDSRERLHHFASSVLTEEEVRSALILGAAAIVILPLLPNEPMGPFDALNPRSVWRLVVLVLLIGAAGHVATRILGPRFGMPVSGLASGFVSSSATIGAMGSHAAKEPGVMGAAAAGAVLSTVATVVQMAVVVGATSPAALRVMTIPLVCAGVAAAAYGAIFTISAMRQKTEGESAGEALSLKTALIFAATLSVVLLISAALREWFGEAGAIAAAALAGFADTHASAISIASLVASGRMEPIECVVPILAGFTTNSVTKVIVAVAAGGRAFALRVVPGVLLVAAAAWGGALFSFAAG
ncbi:DUF4010 domain-containing protein [Phenylobacterium sp. LjRoot219]|uniref:MgtC/SapB family protein n=1 Tax=Phenylobacterium sp. LjRoot219 TaxID=3342283 RepID=UPI003ECC79EA